MLEENEKDGVWATVNTLNHKENVSIQNLERQNFEAYCPKIRKNIRHARRFQIVDRPMFPGYIFVRVASRREQWRPILSTIGVRALVRFGDEIGFVDDRLIAGLKAREHDGVIAAPEEPYRAGQRITVGAGPFEGIIATVISVREQDRLIILMNLLRNKVRATVSANQVRPSS
jgi:transcriptional antiterminator RfaH